MWGEAVRLLLCVLGVLACVPLAEAQPMVDPKAMSGIPRPVSDLPDRALSVRLIRGDLSKNIAGHPVELHVDGRVQTVKTDENGRAEFDDLTPGATLKAVAVVDGEQLISEEFPAPSSGGIRLMLVATDPEKAAGDALAAKAPAVAGQVVISGESRIVMEPDDEMVRVFYLLDLVNNARTPVSLPEVFAFEVPTGAVGTTVMEGSSPRASANGTRVIVEGPFAPGNTFVQVGFTLPASGGSIAIDQRFPANVEQLVVMAEKAGSERLSSPSITRQQEVPANGHTYIVAAGGAIPAGQSLALSLTGLPHHSESPRWIALSLAGGVVLAGFLAAARTTRTPEPAPERKRLLARRERLFRDLVALENDHRGGRVDRSRYASRREELMAALELVYGALDDDHGPEPGDRAGLAA